MREKQHLKESQYLRHKTFTIILNVAHSRANTCQLCKYVLPWKRYEKNRAYAYDQSWTV